jgi:hypothetical protein
MSFPVCWVKNTSGATKTWIGQQLNNLEYYEVANHERMVWAHNDVVLTDIASGDLTVAKDDSGTLDIAGTSDQIVWLQASQIEIGNWNRTGETGAIEVATHKPEQSSASFVTHDWTDKTTWFGQSIRVTDEVMSDSGDGLTFNSANDDWIDLSHGKVFDEDNIIGTAYTVEVKIDDVLQTYEDGYSVDYALGDVVFDASQSGKTIKVTYSYCDGSVWTLAPTAGKKILIEHSEIQVSKNVVMGNGINFEIWVWHPDQVTYPGLKVMYSREKYKSVKDIINAGNQGKGVIPAVAPLTQDVLVFPFNYVTVKTLKNSVGAELRISVDNDVPMGGEWATATFYVVSMDE